MWKISAYNMTAISCLQRNIKKSRHLGCNYAFFYDDAMSLKSDHVKKKKEEKKVREQRYAGQRWYIAPVFANYSEETLLFNDDHIVNAVILTRIYVHRKSSVKDFIKGESRQTRFSETQNKHFQLFSRLSVASFKHLKRNPFFKRLF